jgi:hypothetical protein
MSFSNNTLLNKTNYSKVMTQLRINYNDIKFKQYLRYLPTEILNYIISYNNNSLNEAKHAKVMTQIQTNNKVIRLLNIILDKLWLRVRKQTKLTRIEFLANYLLFETLEKLIKSCKKCYCCNRHSNNKLLSALHGPRSYPKEHKKCEITCFCSCRFMSREYAIAYHLKREKEDKGEGDFYPTHHQYCHNFLRRPKRIP